MTTTVLEPGPGQLGPARAAAGLSTRELARRVGVSRPAVTQWERRGVPAERMAAVERALAGFTDEPLAQLRALLAANPHLTEAQLRARAPHLMPVLEDAEVAGVLHRRHVTARADKAGRCYSRTLLVAGPRPDRQDDPEPLTGEDVAALRHVHGWTPDGLARRLGVSRQRVADLERGPVPLGRQDQLRAVLVDALATCDLAAARTRVGLSQAELARRAGYGPPRLVAWERHRRPLPVADAVRLGTVLAAAEADPSPTAAAAARVVDVVTAAAPDGCTASALTRALSQGRPQGQTGASARDHDGLVLALRRRQVHWAETWTQHRDGSWHLERRLHPGPRPRQRPQGITGADLARARREAGLSQAQLATRVGSASWATVSKWERRGRRPVPPAIAEPVLAACRNAAAAHEERRAAAEHEAAERRRVTRERLLAAAAASPGLTVPQLLVAAGYGRRSPLALSVLGDLEAEQRLHRRLSPNLGGRGGAHTGVHPGSTPDLAEAAPISGTQLHRRRLAAGLRQRDLAAHLGVSQTAVGQWERAEVPAGRRTAVEAVLADLGHDERGPLSGPALREARRAAGLTQADVAARIGVSAAAVTQWERRFVPRDRLDEVRRLLSRG